MENPARDRLRHFPQYAITHVTKVGFWILTKINLTVRTIYKLNIYILPEEYIYKTVMDFSGVIHDVDMHQKIIILCMSRHV